MNVSTIIRAALCEPPFVSVEDQITNAVEAAHALGFSDGRDFERSIDRSLSYAAIRRAIRVARDLERGGWHKMEADAIRWAIRAALKQETP